MASPMVQDFTAPVLRNVDLGRGNWLLEFEAPDDVLAMRAGAVLHDRRPRLGCPVAAAAFGLRSSRERSPDGTPGAVQVLYRVYGRGTKLLASLSTGAPASRARPARPRASRSRSARTSRSSSSPAGSAARPSRRSRRNWSGKGGAQRWSTVRARPTSSRCLDWFRERCDAVVVTTDDGSLGSSGLVDGAPRGDVPRTRPRTTPRLRVRPEPHAEGRGRDGARSGGSPATSRSRHRWRAGSASAWAASCRRTQQPEDLIAYERVCVEGPVMRAERVAW